MGSGEMRVGEMGLGDVGLGGLGIGEMGFDEMRTGDLQTAADSERLHWQHGRIHGAISIDKRIHVAGVEQCSTRTTFGYNTNRTATCIPRQVFNVNAP